MKVLDATSLIAFLVDMKFPEGLVLLSKHYEIIVPEGVDKEIKKPATRSAFEILIKNKVISVVKVNQEKALEIQRENPQLHPGECEVIAFAIEHEGKKMNLLSDDSKARSLFKDLNFRWTQEVLSFMKDRDIISIDTYNEKLEELKNSSFYFKS